MHCKHIRTVSGFFCIQVWVLLMLAILIEVLMLFDIHLRVLQFLQIRVRELHMLLLLLDTLIRALLLLDILTRRIRKTYRVGLVHLRAGHGTVALLNLTFRNLFCF